MITLATIDNLARRLTTETTPLGRVSKSATTIR